MSNLFQNISLYSMLNCLMKRLFCPIIAELQGKIIDFRMIICFSQKFCSTEKTKKKCRNHLRNLNSIMHLFLATILNTFPQLMGILRSLSLWKIAIFTCLNRCKRMWQSWMEFRILIRGWLIGGLQIRTTLDRLWSKMIQIQTKLKVEIYNIDHFLWIYTKICP